MRVTKYYFRLTFLYTQKTTTTHYNKIIIVLNGLFMNAFELLFIFFIRHVLLLPQHSYKVMCVVVSRPKQPNKVLQPLSFSPTSYHKLHNTQDSDFIVE